MAKSYLYDWSIICDVCEEELNPRNRPGYATPEVARSVAGEALERALRVDGWTTDGFWLHCPECGELDIPGIDVAAAIHRKTDLLEALLTENLMVL